MTTPRPTDDELVAALRELLIQLGIAMSAAGDSVDAIDSSLRAIIAAYGVEHVEVAVLPTSLMVSTGQGTGTQIEIGVPQRTPLRFDQVAELYTLVRAASSASISPNEALEKLHTIYRMPPTFRWPVRTLGHAVLTVGLALLLQPTVGAVGAAFVLGLLVGLAKLPRLATLELVFPVVVSFVVSVIVFATLQHVQIDNPVRILIPPLVTFLPGAALTIATVELAAGQMVSGASRLVSGLVQLLLLAFGILAASALFELSAEVLADNPVNRLGWWAPWVGVVVFALGNYLHLSAPARSLPWMLVIMLAAYAGQVAGAAVFGGAAQRILRRPRDDAVGTLGGDPEERAAEAGHLPSRVLAPRAWRSRAHRRDRVAQRQPPTGGAGGRRLVGHGDVHRPRGADRHGRLPHHRLRTPRPQRTG